MTSYGVTFDIQQPERYDRTQIAIRILILIVGSLLVAALGWIHGALYLAIPVLAAILISQKGAQTYFAESEQNMAMWLRYIVAAYAYLGLLTDKLPNEDPRQTLRFEIAPSGEPTEGRYVPGPTGTASRGPAIAKLAGSAPTTARTSARHLMERSPSARAPRPPRQD